MGDHTINDLRSWSKGPYVKWSKGPPSGHFYAAATKTLLLAFLKKMCSHSRHKCRFYLQNDWQKSAFYPRISQKIPTLPNLLLLHKNAFSTKLFNDWTKVLRMASW